MHDPADDVAVVLDITDPISALEDAIAVRELTSFHILFTSASTSHGFLAGVIRGPEAVVRTIIDKWGYGEDYDLRWTKSEIPRFVDGAGFCLELIPEETK